MTLEDVIATHNALCNRKHGRAYWDCSFKEASYALQRYSQLKESRYPSVKKWRIIAERVEEFYGSLYEGLEKERVLERPVTGAPRPWGRVYETMDRVG